jgi:hypothetical protein
MQVCIGAEAYKVGLSSTKPILGSNEGTTRFLHVEDMTEAEGGHT